MTARRTRYRGPRQVPRTTAVNHITEHLEATGAGGERQPIIVVFGPEGIGKKSLLTELNQQLNQRTPRAFVDCSRYSTEQLPGLLTEIKFKLGRHCPGIGRVRFRRLETGLAATREPLDFEADPRRAIRRLAVLTRREIFPDPDDVRRIVGEVTESLEIVPAWLSTLIGEAAAAGTSRALAGPLLLDRYQKWYGHRDLGQKEDPLEELAELNSWAQADDLHPQRDERLLEAFLADVRDAFGHGSLARSQWYNCVLLLDRVDTDTGQAVLRHLEQLRREHLTAGTAAEPLLVVAASRRRLQGDFLAHYRLPEFTEAEMRWLAKYVPGEADHRFHKAMHQLTGGYPAAARSITEAASRRPAAAAGSLDAVLKLQLDDQAAVEEELLGKLVNALLRQPGQRPIPDSAMVAFATCALARTLDDAQWLAGMHQGGFVIDRQLLAETGLWDDEGGTVAHELLRRLLLRKLAVRDSEPTSWTTVSTLLRDRCKDRRELGGELYYALAAEDVEMVARRLTEHLAGDGIEQPWLDLLMFVTEAPRRSVASSEASPYQQQLDLAGVVARDPTPHLIQIAQLVAGLWLANDPCTPPDRADLHGQLALDLHGIAPYADRPMDLQNEARRHESLAQYWS